MADVLAPKAQTAPRRGRLIIGVLAAAVVIAMAVDTTVVRIGSERDARQQGFSADAFGEEHFPRIQTFVDGKAVDAATLGPAVLGDKDAAAKQYGTPSWTGAIMPVKLTGVVGEGKAGVYELKVDGVPADIRVRVQTGPAINGRAGLDADTDVGRNAVHLEFIDARLPLAHYARELHRHDRACPRGRAVLLGRGILVAQNRRTERRGVHSLAVHECLDAREVLLAKCIRGETLLTRVPLRSDPHDGRVDRHGDDHGRREHPDDEASAARRGLGL